jgi:hypothetical protein
VESSTNGFAVTSPNYGTFLVVQCAVFQHEALLDIAFGAFGSLWKPLAHHGRLWARSGDPWVALGSHFVCLGRPLGSSWRLLGSF